MQASFGVLSHIAYRVAPGLALVPTRAQCLSWLAVAVEHTSFPPFNLF